MHGWCQCCAVNEGAAFGAGEEIVIAEEDGIHCFVVGHHCEDNVGIGGYIGEFSVSNRADFSSELSGDAFVNVEDGAHIVALVFEAASHVTTHAAEADESDCFVFHSIWFVCTFA